MVSLGKDGEASRSLTAAFRRFGVVATDCRPLDGGGKRFIIGRLGGANVAARREEGLKG
jgi:hypothetical protein